LALALTPPLAGSHVTACRAYDPPGAADAGIGGVQTDVRDADRAVGLVEQFQHRVTHIVSERHDTP